MLTPPIGFQIRGTNLQLYEQTLKISAFMTVEGIADIDLNAKAGTTFPLTSTSTVTIIDPFEEYVSVLKTCFDFDAITEFAKRPGFSILFDGMHGAGGPFAKRVLQEELGFPEVSEWQGASTLPYRYADAKTHLTMSR
jgi:phosphoglucomutase